MTDICLIGDPETVQSASKVATDLHLTFKSIVISFNDAESSLDDVLMKRPAESFFVAVGPNHLNSWRPILCKAILSRKLRLISLVSPSASIGDNVKIGVNVLVGSGSSIRSDVIIGNGSLLGESVIVGRKSKISNFVWLADDCSIHFSKVGACSIIGSMVHLHSVDVSARSEITKAGSYHGPGFRISHYLKGTRAPIFKL